MTEPKTPKGGGRSMLALGLSTATLAVLQALSEKTFSWARVHPETGDPAICLKTVAYYGHVEGFILRMWADIKPEGPGVTILVGDSFCDPLTVEWWGALDLGPNTVPVEADRPDLPIKITQIYGVADAVAAVEEELKRAYQMLAPGL